METLQRDRVVGSGYYKNERSYAELQYGAGEVDESTSREGSNSLPKYDIGQTANNIFAELYLLWMPQAIGDVQRLLMIVPCSKRALNLHYYGTMIRSPINLTPYLTHFDPLNEPLAEYDYRRLNSHMIEQYHSNQCTIPNDCREMNSTYTYLASTQGLWTCN